jgi:hypothetical protein
MGKLFLSRHRLYDMVVLLLVTAIALYGAWLYRNFAQDDAFITYRYARNIAEGHGFVYNFNEPLLGTTTPLYTLILAALARLSGQEVRLLSHWLGIISLWGAAILLYDLGRNRERRTAAAAALIFISNPLLITAIGMETFFLLALMLLALKTYQLERFNLTGVLLGLVILTRYELAIFAAILGLHYWLKQQRLPWWLISAAGVVTLWLVYAWLTFGHVIPRSAVAKLVEDQGFSFAMGVLLWWWTYVMQSAWYYLFIPLLLLGSYSAVRNRSHEPAYGLVLIWSAVYFAVAAFIAGTFVWYYGPLIPGLAILLAWGVDQVARMVGKLSNSIRGAPYQETWQPAILAVLALGLILLQLSSWGKGFVYYQDQVVDVRYVNYRQVADWLNRHTTADRQVSLAVSEIGVLGYYTDNLKIVDLYGLVTPGLIPWLRSDRAELLEEAIRLYAPDYLLIDAIEMKTLLQHRSDYEPIEEFDNGTYILYVKQ